MGWKRAVAIAQEVHMELVLRGGCDEPKVRYGRPVPRGPLMSGMVVDDFNIFEKKPMAEMGEPGRCEEELGRAVSGYASGNIAPKREKVKEKVIRGDVWGATLDGAEGWISAATDKLVQLCLLTCGVLQCFEVSSKVVEQLIGGWGFALMFRRQFFSLLSESYAGSRGDEVVERLPSSVACEMLGLALCTPLLRSNVRASYGGKLWCHDAEGSGVRRHP